MIRQPAGRLEYSTQIEDSDGGQEEGPAANSSLRVYVEVPRHSPMSSPATLEATTVAATKSAQPTEVPYLPMMIAPLP